MKFQSIGVGPTAKLSLRVSVATLCRVILPRPTDEARMLALEHKATVFADGGDIQVLVKAQPFGGAIRIMDDVRLFTRMDGFNFDSERSRAEGDFRIFIQPVKWEALREYCLQLDDNEVEPYLDVDPSRELVEEFEDALGIQLSPEQYNLKRLWTVVENEAAPTENVRAHGNLTARIYYVSEIQVTDPTICRLMINNSERYPAQVLRVMALEDAQRYGSGRANAMLITPFDKLNEVVRTVSPEKRGLPLDYEGTILDGNVIAILEELSVPKYDFY